MKIVTFTCDCYADIAPAFLHFINAGWSDCPYEIIFVTNRKKLDVDVPTFYLSAHPDIDFGWRCREFILRHYTDDLLLLMMADYLVKSADQPLVAKAEQLCQTEGVRHVRLRPMPHPQLDYPLDADFGRIDKKARYSLSLQPGIWESQVLYDLCDPRESAHHTETHGSTRVKNVPGLFLSTQRMAIAHHNYYKHGKSWGYDLVASIVPERDWPNGVKRWASKR